MLGLFPTALAVATVIDEARSAEVADALQDGQGVVSVPRSGAEVLSRRMRELLKLCETAGDLGRINWS